MNQEKPACRPAERRQSAIPSEMFPSAAPPSMRRGPPERMGHQADNISGLRVQPAVQKEVHRVEHTHLTLGQARGSRSPRGRSKPAAVPPEATRGRTPSIPGKTASHRRQSASCRRCRSARARPGPRRERRPAPTRRVSNPSELGTNRIDLKAGHPPNVQCLRHTCELHAVLASIAFQARLVQLTRGNSFKARIDFTRQPA